MTPSFFPYHLYLVISKDSCVKHDFLMVTEQAIRGGVDLIQLREKDIPAKEYAARARKLKNITDQYHVPLIINDDVEVMQEVRASGVHVGNSDQSPGEIRQRFENDYMIGYSVEQAGQATNEKAMLSDYIAASPVFNTNTKTNTIIEWGLNGVAAIRDLTAKPLVAIGNMNRHNAAAVIRAGADCIAVVSAICAADDPFLAAHELKQIILHEKNI